MKQTFNIQHSIPNGQRRLPGQIGCELESGRCILKVFRTLALAILLLTPSALLAQMPPVVPLGAQLQLQVAQPAVDVESPVTASAEFDPPVVRPGDKAFYRVTVDATESAIQWPDESPEPVGLTFGPKVSGQITEMLVAKYRPITSFVYEVRPSAEGHFIVTNFSVNVMGAEVQIPPASLDVSNGVSVPPARQLFVEVSGTNLYLGQPFKARVILPATAANPVEAVREIEFHGAGLMVDKNASQQFIEPANVNGVLKNAYICEMVVTPISAGQLEFFAQGFTAGREFVSPIIIRGQVNLQGGPPKYTLLVSDPVRINVRPLPVDGELPGFTGSIGKFFSDPPQLSTNRLQVGEPVQLTVQFHGEGDLTRLAPPEVPRSREWQIIADPPPATSFTLIPHTDDVHETPAIPFSYFDPAEGRYVDLTIPAMPVTVTGTGLPLALPASSAEPGSGIPAKLSDLASLPGKTVRTLTPLQLQSWFPAVQLLPVFGLLALWQWDRRRRFLEAYPDIRRRMLARRELRRERRRLAKAADDGDTTAFIHHAVQAMNIAAAPHFPANPRALVSGDVLMQLNGSAANGKLAETVRTIFSAADAQFAKTPMTQTDMLALHPSVEAVLEELEAKL